MDETMPDLAQAPEPATPPETPRRPFRLPAEYYASPERSPVLPRAVPFGCGAAALLFLIVLFVAGAMADRFMPWLFGYMQKEADGQFTKDVPAADRAEFDRQFSELQARLKSGRTKLTRLQPFLEKLRDASMDEHITPEETKKLNEALRELNR